MAEIYKMKAAITENKDFSQSISSKRFPPYNHV